MVRLTVTRCMEDAIRSLQGNGKQLPGTPTTEDLAAKRSGSPIAHDQVIALAHALKCDPTYSLDRLLHGSEVYIDPPKPKAPQSSEYQALMARLRKEEDARAYERMIHPSTSTPSAANATTNAKLFAVSSAADLGDEDEVAYADVSRQLAVIVNVLISVVACAAAIWVAARHWSTASRLGLSMAGGGIVGVAEVVVYLGYMRRVQAAKQREKKMAERKTIVDTWVIGGDDNADVTRGEKRGPDVVVQQEKDVTTTGRDDKASKTRRRF